ncbi:MAG: peptide deformylase [Fibrobacter sp.]|nr:peptide deformylase [Fibrobacter sp.]
MEVKIYGDPVLRKTAKPVEMFDDELKRFVEEMIQTMLIEDGAGLAAPQVGISRRIAVIDVTGGEEEPVVIINPKIYYYSEDKESKEEGCLSLPGINLSVNRSVMVSVKAMDINGNEFTIEKAQGFLARALQHEIDHLDGIMIIDHVSVLQRKLISSKLKKMAKTGRDKSNAV